MFKKSNFNFNYNYNNPFRNYYDLKTYHLKWNSLRLTKIRKKKSPPKYPPHFNASWGVSTLLWAVLSAGTLASFYEQPEDFLYISEEELEDEVEEEEFPHINVPVIDDSDLYVSPLEKVLFIVKSIIRFIQIINYFLPLIAFMPLSMVSTRFRSYWWVSVRFVLKQLGGSWIKIGQWASTRPDLFSKEIIHFISEICHNCPSHSFTQTKQIIESNYGKEMSELFSYFPETPVASGAVAQVYIATLKNGKKVAVKVLHPGVAHLINMDLFIMRHLVSFIEYFPGVKWLSLSDAIIEFSQTMKAQTDLRIEGRNLLIFNQNFAGDTLVSFPKLIEEFIPTRSVLVESYEEGEHLINYLNSVTDETKAIANIGLNAYLKMMLIDNFVHADLHPGNILVRKDSNNQISLVFLDVGLIFNASVTDWLHFKQLFKAIVEKNGKFGASLMVRFARDHSISPNDEEIFTTEMGKLFASIRELKMCEIDVGSFLASVLYLVRQYRVKIEGNFATLCVATTVMEGIGRQLDPDINILDASIPLIISAEVIPDNTETKLQLIYEYTENKWKRWTKNKSS